MVDVVRRGLAAERLLADETFLDVVATIRADATGVFSNAKSGIDDIAEAHEAIRAVETILDEVRGRISTAQIQEKSEGRHRASD